MDGIWAVCVQVFFVLSTALFIVCADIAFPKTSRECLFGNSFQGLCELFVRKIDIIHSCVGRLSARLLVRSLYLSQSAFLKFHLGPGALLVKEISGIVRINEGRC